MVLPSSGVLNPRGHHWRKRCKRRGTVDVPNEVAPLHPGREKCEHIRECITVCHKIVLVITRLSLSSQKCRRHHKTVVVRMQDARRTPRRGGYFQGTEG